MSTRSRIAIQLEDGRYRSIYCHWDGYPDHNGRVLATHYTDIQTIHALLDNGDLSTLESEIGEKHPFEDRGNGVCTFYGRDRGEAGVEAIVSPDLDHLRVITDACFGDYLYLFQGGRWFCAVGASGLLLPLSIILESEPC